MRNTRQKQAIREAFAEANRPLLPEEALAEAQKLYHGIGIATVYRNIRRLVEDGWLVPVDIPGQTPRYELFGKRHHHHFHCNQCDRVYDLEGCATPLKPRLPKGFTVLAHEYYLFGSCMACQRA